MRSSSSHLSAIAGLALILSAPVDTAAQQWPGYRGPGGTAVAAASAAPPVTFDTTSPSWKLTLPGLAHSSPIVWDDRIYVTTAVAPGADTSVRTGNSDAAGIGAANDMVAHTWRLMAIDRATGKVIWDREAYTGVPRLKRHVKASHASATPATNGRVIVALLGSEGLFAFDMNGAVKWKQDLGVMDVGLVGDPTYQWGPASSPVIFENLVIVQNDRHKDSFLAAFDLETGKEVWRATRDELPSWATPLVYTGSGRTELVTNSGKFIRGYDPRTGRELWRMSDADTQVKVPSPVAAGGLIIVTGGWPSNGRPIYAFRPGLTGDVAPDAALAWRTERGSPYTPTPVVYEGVLHVISDNGILTAYDTATGARIYQQRVSETAGAFSASPIVAAGRLFLASEDGEIFVVRAGRTYELLASNKIGEILMATPAVAGNTLIVRSQHQLFAFAAR
jgi:outer membrane protein assembly factor BamB